MPRQHLAVLCLDVLLASAHGLLSCIDRTMAKKDFWAARESMLALVFDICKMMSEGGGGGGGGSGGGSAADYNSSFSARSGGGAYASALALAAARLLPHAQRIAVRASRVSSLSHIYLNLILEHHSLRAF